MKDKKLMLPRGLRYMVLCVCTLLLVLGLAACGGQSATESAGGDAAAQSLTTVQPQTIVVETNGHNGPMKVEVVLGDGRITAINILEHVETAGVADGALTRIPQAIVANQSVEVDTVSGASVTSIAIRMAVTEALKRAGWDVAGFSGKPQQTARQDVPAEEITTDVLVVGGGGAGLAAAVSAIEEGYDVILLEKLSYTGGGFTYVEGVFGLNSPIQQAQGVEMDVESMFKETMDFHHWLVNSTLVKTFYENAGDSIEWLMDRGVKFRGVITANPPDGNIAWHLFDGGQAGRLAVKNLTDRIESAPNGRILYETPGKELIIEDGEVTGVVAYRADGSRLNIHASAVILATGGFSSNQELKDKYLRFPGYENVGAGGREGDGLAMLEQVNARFESMSSVLGAGLVMPIPISQQMGPDTKYPGILSAIYNEGLLTLSPQGARYMNERLPIEYRSNATEHVGGSAYVVFDQKTVEEFMTTGQRFGFGAPGMVPELQAGLDKALAEGNDWIFKADTLDELARLTGMHADTLKENVGKINRYTAQGHDPDFYLEKEALFSVDTAPYYAVRVILGMYATVGGAHVTEHLQVVDNEGNIVPNLYAIGLDAGGMYGDTYDMRIANGAASGFSITSGRLAARHIASWLEK